MNGIVFADRTLLQACCANIGAKIINNNEIITYIKAILSGVLSYFSLLHHHQTRLLSLQIKLYRMACKMQDMSKDSELPQ